MIFPKSKALIQCISLVLAVALRPPVVLGNNMKNNNNSESWMHKARALNQREFVQACDEVFLSPEHLRKNSYLMSDYAMEVTDLCLKFAPDPEQGTCRKNGFGSLGATLQNTFFQHAAHHMGREKLPISVLISMGDAGYIVSDKTSIELDSMRNDLCVGLHESFGDYFLEQIPASNIPEYAIIPLPLPPQTEPIQVTVPDTEPEVAPVLIENSPVTSSTELNIGEDELNTENINNEAFTITEVEEDHLLSIGTIIGLSCAVALCLVLLFYIEARRRDRARSRYAGKRKLSLSEDGVIKVSSSSSNKKTRSFGSLSTTSSRSASVTFTPIDEIKGAINNADWDNIYKLASQLAENDDGLSVSSIGSFRCQSRSHLAAEDQERTRTLDELAAKGDWTGLAVTAALYAGETSGSTHEYSNTFAYGIDEPSTRRDTIKTQKPSTVRLSSFSSSRGQDIEEGQSSMEQMVSSLSAALNVGDWSQVNYFAGKIKEEKGGNSFDTDSQAFVISAPGLISSTSSILSTDTTDTETSKKQTIEKLMRAGKWKGVSIMANMYEMESKQSNCSSSMQSYPTTPTHQYKDTRSFRTKELRHADRVQKNIVGFRRDP